MILKIKYMKKVRSQKKCSVFMTTTATVLIFSFLLSLIPATYALPKTAVQPKNPPEASQSVSEVLEYNNVLLAKKKDPIFAGMLSWYIPGLGQYYSGEIWKGTAFLVTEYTLVIAAFFYFVNIDFSAGNKSGFNIRIDAKRTDLGLVSTSRRNIFYGIMGIVLVIHLFNISDAVMSARKFNMLLDEKRMQFNEKYPSLDLSYDGKNGVYLGMQRAF